MPYSKNPYNSTFHLSYFTLSTPFSLPHDLEKSLFPISKLRNIFFVSKTSYVDGVCHLVCAFGCTWCLAFNCLHCLFPTRRVPEADKALILALSCSSVPLIITSAFMLGCCSEHLRRTRLSFWAALCWSSSNFGYIAVGARGSCVLDTESMHGA